MSYNGWSNYETWRVNLEMLDGYDIADWMDGSTYDLTDDDGRDDAIYALAQYFSEMVHEIVERESKGFAYGLAVSFLNEVDWQEIAAHYIDDYIAENA